MELFDSISRRKSTRKYTRAPLPDETLAQVLAFAQNARPLFPGVKTEFAITDSVGGLMPVKAPHYILAYSEQAEGYLPNIGFMLQQIDLFLSSRGLGSCWVGGARAEQKALNGLSFVIAMAFGEAAESPYRELAEFNRKGAEDIASGYDRRLESVRLAPSAVNSQPWYYVCQGDEILVYRQKLGAVRAVIYDKLNQIDMGIGLCHLWLAGERERLGFSFSAEPNPAVEPVRGYEYFGAVR